MRITGEEARHLRLQSNLYLEKKLNGQKKNEAEAQKRFEEEVRGESFNHQERPMD